MINALKLQGRMERILRPQQVCFSSSLLDGFIECAVSLPERWQCCRLHNCSSSSGTAFPSAISRRARWAALTKPACVFLNEASHLISSRKSSIYSRRCSTTRSCASSGKDSIIIVTVVSVVDVITFTSSNSLDGSLTQSYYRIDFVSHLGFIRLLRLKGSRQLADFTTAYCRLLTAY